MGWTGTKTRRRAFGVLRTKTFENKRAWFPFVVVRTTLHELRVGRLGRFTIFFLLQNALLHIKIYIDLYFKFPVT